MRHLKHPRLIAWTATIVWAGVIFGLSSVPGSNIPGRFGSLAHFVEYAILSGLLTTAIRLDAPPTFAATRSIVAASLYAVTDEFHQSFVPMRTPDPVDWLVDTAGAVAGALAALAIHTVIARMRTARESD